MIQVVNGGLLTSTAATETIVPVTVAEDGGLVVAHRHLFQFEVVSGTVKTALGCDPSNPPNSMTAGSHTTTSGTKWQQTLAPQLQDGGIRNLQISGVGTVIVTW